MYLVEDCFVEIQFRKKIGSQISHTLIFVTPAHKKLLLLFPFLVFFWQQQQQQQQQQQLNQVSKPVSCWRKNRLNFLSTYTHVKTNVSRASPNRMVFKTQRELKRDVIYGRPTFYVIYSCFSRLHDLFLHFYLPLVAKILQ